MECLAVRLNIYATSTFNFANGSTSTCVWRCTSWQTYEDCSCEEPALVRKSRWNMYNLTFTITVIDTVIIAIDPRDCTYWFLLSHFFHFHLCNIFCPKMNVKTDSYIALITDQFYRFIEGRRVKSDDPPLWSLHVQRTLCHSEWPVTVWLMNKTKYHKMDR